MTATNPTDLLYRKTALIRATQWHKMGDHPAVVPLVPNKRDPSNPNYSLPNQTPPPNISLNSQDYMPGMETTHGYIKALEGGHVVTPGDWIATGAEGEHWPIKPSVFAATYALATPAAPAMGTVVNEPMQIGPGSDDYGTDPYTYPAPPDAKDIVERLRGAHELIHGERSHIEAQAADAITTLRSERDALVKERDLAIAHDRQPYPTAHAYEQACKSLREAQADLAASREACRVLGAEIRERAKHSGIAMDNPQASMSRCLGTPRCVAEARAAVNANPIAKAAIRETQA